LRKARTELKQGRNLVTGAGVEGLSQNQASAALHVTFMPSKPILFWEVFPENQHTEAVFQR